MSHVLKLFLEVIYARIQKRWELNIIDSQFVLGDAKKRFLKNFLKPPWTTHNFYIKYLNKIIFGNDHFFTWWVKNIVSYYMWILDKMKKSNKLHCTAIRWGNAINNSKHIFFNFIQIMNKQMNSLYVTVFKFLQAEFISHWCLGTLKFSSHLTTFCRCPIGSNNHTVIFFVRLKSKLLFWFQIVSSQFFHLWSKYSFRLGCRVNTAGFDRNIKMTSYF